MSGRESYWRVKALFAEALEQPSDEREGFVRAACADDHRLFEEVTDLLAVHDGTGGLFSQPTANPAHVLKTSSIPGESPGESIGRYKLLQLIGEGGFGAVYLAEQDHPVRRRVALKIIKLGMDTRQVIARFEAERQALAMMDHAGIAKVFDAGATETGRPYFVMELVNGIPITEYCDKRNLGITDRLELFVQVCHAVQHAHQKGVIHRDLKPSNVLVSLQDDRPVARVIDFGIAKATQARLTEKTMFTEFTQLIGTPEYMSPEQADGSLDIDTRSDVYSLGVLLYELLTGTTPFDARDLRSKAYGEIQRIICEVDPVRPSTKLSTLEGLPTIAAHRSTEPRKLSASVRGELDWIVMKCLEKDRARRYESASSVAADVQRHLSDEPVSAGPQAAWYRFRKLGRRHKTALITASIVVAALLAGTALASWQALVATRAKQQALAAAAAEKKANAWADAQLAQMRDVIDFVEKNIFAAARPIGHTGGLGRNVTLRQAIDAALLRIDSSFQGQPLLEGRVRAMIGMAFKELGDLKAAEPQLSLALQRFNTELGHDQPNTLFIANVLANLYGDLGRHNDALELHARTLELRKATLGADHPDTLRSMDAVALSYFALGRYAEALKLHEQTLALRKAKLGADHLDTLATMHNLAGSYEALGRRDEALQLREDSYQFMKARFGPSDPDTLRTMGNLAVSYANFGRHAEALKLREESLVMFQSTLGEDHPHTLITMNNLASTYEALGRNAEAMKLHEETLRLRTAKLGPDHPDTILSLANVAFSLDKLDRCDEAVLIIDECMKRSEGKDVDPRLAPGTMDLRLRIFEKQRNAAGCRDTSEMWEKLNRNDAESLYIAAGMHGVTASVIRAGNSDSTTSESAAEADRAVEWLTKAAAAGFKDSARLEQDNDFAALRERDDFKKLLAEIKSIP